MSNTKPEFSDKEWRHEFTTSLRKYLGKDLAFVSTISLLDRLSNGDG